MEVLYENKATLFIAIAFNQYGLDNGSIAFADTGIGGGACGAQN
jgi:hypothetical protein